MRLLVKGLLRTSILLCLSITCALAQKAAPEFGDSISFDSEGPDLLLSRLRGKAVVMVFIQSASAAYDDWGPMALKQAEASFGNNRAVALVLIKTDGGSTGAIKKYVKEHGLDRNKWYIATDSKGEYMMQIAGQDALWIYVQIDSTGNIVRVGQVGSYWNEGGQKGRFVIADREWLASCGEIQRILPEGKSYPESLSQIVLCAEAGAFGKALKLCESAARKSKEKESVTELRKDILAIVDGRADIVLGALYAQQPPDWGVRYEMYKVVSDLLADVADVPAAARNAKSAAAKLARHPKIEQERAAEAAYLGARLRFDKASSRDKSRALTNLRRVAKKYQGTRYGKLAAADVTAFEDQLTQATK
jgi:hypothetical protein